MNHFEIWPKYREWARKDKHEAQVRQRVRNRPSPTCRAPTASRRKFPVNLAPRGQERMIHTTYLAFWVCSVAADLWTSQGWALNLDQVGKWGWEYEGFCLDSGVGNDGVSRKTGLFLCVSCGLVLQFSKRRISFLQVRVFGWHWNLGRRGINRLTSRWWE